MTTVALAGWEFEDSARLGVFAADLGVDAVEAAPWNIASVGVERFAELMVAHGLGVSCVSTGIDHRFESEPTDEVRRWLLACVDQAEALGAGLVTTYVGSSYDVSYAATVRAIHSGIAPCAEYARDRGISILVENVFDTVGDDPEGRQLSRTIDGCERLMEGLADLDVGMTLDPCNFVVTGQDPWEAFQRLRSHVRNLHVKDAVRSNGPADPGAVVWHDSVGGDFNGVPSGTGDSRLEEILVAAVTDNPDLTITVEHAVADVLGQFAADRYAAEVEWARRVAGTA